MPRPLIYEMYSAKRISRLVLTCHQHRHHRRRPHRHSLELGDYFSHASIPHPIITPMDYDVEWDYEPC